MLLDDSVNHGKAEPCPFAPFLGGEKRLEDLVDRLFVHPPAGIGDGHQAIAAGCAEAVGLAKSIIEFEDLRGNGEGAAPRHGIPGVRGKIHQHLFELVTVGKDRYRPFGQVGLALDILPDNPADEFFHMRNHAVEIQFALIDYLFSAEEQQILGEVRGLQTGLDDDVDIFPVGIIFLHRFEGEFSVTENCRKDIIEIMGYAAGKGAYRFHLLGLVQLFFKFSMGRNIAN